MGWGHYNALVYGRRSGDDGFDTLSAPRDWRDTRKTNEDGDVIFHRFERHDGPSIGWRRGEWVGAYVADPGAQWCTDVLGANPLRLDEVRRAHAESIAAARAQWSKFRTWFIAQTGHDPGEGHLMLVTGYD